MKVLKTDTRCRKRFVEACRLQRVEYFEDNKVVEAELEYYNSTIIRLFMCCRNYDCNTFYK